MRWLLVFFAGLSLWADEISLSEFASRRATLRQKLNDSVAVVHGKTEKEAEDDRNGFFQSPNYYYLTGLRDPGGVLVLTGESETLYLAKRDANAEKWTGPRLSLEDDASKITGIAHVRPLDSLESDLGKLKSKKRAELPKLLALQRMKKSDAELAVMQKAIEASMAAHKASWKTSLREIRVSGSIGDDGGLLRPWMPTKRLRTHRWKRPQRHNSSLLEEQSADGCGGAGTHGCRRGV